MCNVTTKLSFLFSVCTIAGAMTLTTACSDGNSRKAGALLDEAKSELDAGNFEHVIILTDSIKSAYPREIDIRREALHLATRATEGLTVIQLQEADSIAAVLGAKGDSLVRLMKYVENPIEGYYVAASAMPSTVGASDGIVARVSPDGDFYLISTLKSRKVKSTSVSVSDGTSFASTPSVTHDGERNDRSMGAEVITFIGVEADSVGKFIYENRDKTLTLSFNGESSFSIPLSVQKIDEIALVYDYATTLRNFKLASLEKERLTRALDIARSQAARTFVEKDSISR